METVFFVVKEPRGQALAQLKKIRANSDFMLKPKRSKITEFDDPIEQFKPPQPPKISNFEKTEIISYRALLLADSPIQSFFSEASLSKANAILQNFSIEYKFKFFQKQIFDVKITKTDISLLESNAWVNDNVVSGYLNLIRIYHPGIYVLNSFFYTKIKSSGVTK